MKPDLLIVLSFLLLLSSCRKPIDHGKIIRVSGTVIDSIKNKKLANAKVYLVGATSSFYGTYYGTGPFDSAITDNSGNFSIQYTAEGQSTDYGLCLPTFSVGDGYNNQSTYIADPYFPFSRLNRKKTVTNIVVKGRELNYLKIHLIVQGNPFDSFYVRNGSFDPLLIMGQAIDTTIILRHLPREPLFINYYTQAIRDTAGLAALNSNPYGRRYSVRRAIIDTSFADLSDTIRINKTISNALSMPRQ